jgi:arylsulfatase A-like enzyme
MFSPEDVILRDNVPEHMQARTREMLCGYYAMIANLDDNVGRILNWLDETDQTDNTLVVFFSDHGDMMGSQGRMHKQVPHEESIHIPLIMRMPGVLKAGGTYNGLASGIDIYPTCAGLCQVRVDPDLQGLDLSGSMDGTGGVQRAEAYIQWDGTRFAFGDHPYRAIRTQRYTYAVGRDQEFCLLFDNKADEFQLSNLFGKPEVEELQKRLHRRLIRTCLHAGEDLPVFMGHSLG